MIRFLIINYLSLVLISSPFLSDSIAEEREKLPLPGTFVRLTKSSNLEEIQIEGKLESSRGESFVLIDQNASTILIPKTDVVQLEVNTRRDLNPKLAVIGIVFGGGLGFLIAYMTEGRGQINSSILPGLLLGFPVGAAIGGLTGYYFGRERWEIVYPENQP